MKSKFLAVGLLLFCVVVALGSRSQPVQTKNWRYHFEVGLSQEQANKLGAEGWELVAIAPPEGEFKTIYYIFKQPW